MSARRFHAPKAPTAHDLKLWVALATKAEAAARKPGGDPAPLMRAADRAAKARSPIGEQHKDSPCFRLYALATLWWRLAPEVRADRAGQLTELAAAVRLILDRPTGASAARKPRADIDG